MPWQVTQRKTGSRVASPMERVAERTFLGMGPVTYQGRGGCRALEVDG